MKINEYVRTKDGIIGKIESKNYFGYADYIIDTLYYNDDEIINGWTCGIKKYDIIKSSPNIIDLIEVGDYVNGQLVKHIAYFEGVEQPIKKLIFADEYHLIPTEVCEQKDIKSIVTKEMYSSVEYRVENN